MTRKHTHQAGAAPRVPQMAECPCPTKPSKRSGESPLTRSHHAGVGAWRPLRISRQGHGEPAEPYAATSRSAVARLAAGGARLHEAYVVTNNQFLAHSQEASTMGMIRKRSRTDDGAPAMVRAATEHSLAHRGPARNQATDAVGAAGCGGHLLTSPGRETSGSLADRGRPGDES